MIYLIFVGTVVTIGSFLLIDENGTTPSINQQKYCMSELGDIRFLFFNLFIQMRSINEGLSFLNRMLCSKKEAHITNTIA